MVWLTFFFCFSVLKVCFKGRKSTDWVQNQPYEPLIDKKGRPLEYMPWELANADVDEVRRVVDKLTGDQVFITGSPTYEFGEPNYRILRRSRIDLRKFDNGWKDAGIGDFWSVETRRLSELMPLYGQEIGASK